MTSARTTKNTEEKLGARGGQFLKPDLSAKQKKAASRGRSPPGHFLSRGFLNLGLAVLSIIIIIAKVPMSSLGCTSQAAMF